MVSGHSLESRVTECGPAKFLSVSLRSVLFAVTPTINRTAVDVSLKTVVNRTQIFDCPVTGIPAPQVVWMRDGKLIDARHSGNIELRDAGRRLVIRSVSVSDTATYRCVASNAAGQDFVDFDFHVHGIYSSSLADVGLLAYSYQGR